MRYSLATVRHSACFRFMGGHTQRCDTPPGSGSRYRRYGVFLRYHYKKLRISGATDLSYVQLVGDGVASADLGFPMRYSHSSREVCDVNDLVGLTRLLVAMVTSLPSSFSLLRGV